MPSSVCAMIRISNYMIHSKISMLSIQTVCGIRLTVHFIFVVYEKRTFLISNKKIQLIFEHCTIFINLDTLDLLQFKLSWANQPICGTLYFSVLSLLQTKTKLLFEINFFCVQRKIIITKKKHKMFLKVTMRNDGRTLTKCET